MEFQAERDIQLSITGDATAFKRIVDEYMQAISRVAFKIVGDLNAAADITQDTFIKAYRSLDVVRDPARLGSWLCGIARTTSIDWLRSNKRTVAMEDLGLDQDQIDALAIDNRDALAIAIEEETRMVVLQVIDDMPMHYREALLLKYVNQMSYEEIARSINTSVSAVESLLYRGRMVLREKLTRVIDGDPKP